MSDKPRYPRKAETDAEYLRRVGMTGCHRPRGLVPAGSALCNIADRLDECDLRANDLESERDDLEAQVSELEAKVEELTEELFAFQKEYGE